MTTSPFATQGGSAAQPSGPDPLAGLPRATVLVVFGARWAAVCAPLQRMLETLGPKVEVRVVDVDEWPQHAEAYRVVSVPTFVAVRGGQEVRRRVGASSRSDLTALLRR